MSHFWENIPHTKLNMTKLFVLIVCIPFYSFGYASAAQPSQPATKEVQTDSLTEVDKKSVTAQTVREVFTNYYQKILAIRKNYAPMSRMNYIDAYVKTALDSVGANISNKVYIHRFATNEKGWTDTDLSEVIAITRIRTIDRIKAISKDVDEKVLNALTTNTNDKAELTEAEVKAEIKE